MLHSEPDAIKTIANRDPNFKVFLNNINDKKLYNMITPVGLTNGDILKYANEPLFKKFQKCNKNRRRSVQYNHKDEYVKVLLLRNLLSNRRSLEIMDNDNFFGAFGHNYFRTNTNGDFEPLKSLLKWPGGKRTEIINAWRNMRDVFPAEIESFYEPFIGGGACYFGITADKMFINDKSKDLIGLYCAIQSQDRQYFRAIEDITVLWKEIHKEVLQNKEFLFEAFKHNNVDLLINFFDKFRIGIRDVFGKSNRDILGSNIKEKILRIGKFTDMAKRDVINNIEGAYKAAIYTYIRYLYNSHSLCKSKHTAAFYFLREYCYSSMFRYSSNGDFNVPYGGVSYNDHLPNDRFCYWKDNEYIEHLKKTTICNMDFEAFLKKYPPSEKDFIFIDPPYDTEFSTYDKNIFNKNDQIRLANYLINECRGKWMLVIKSTDFIYSLYNKLGITIRCVNKNYAVNFKNRNNRGVKHLIITNY